MTSLALAVTGLLLLVWRMTPRARRGASTVLGGWAPLVSIIVPARDEEHRLPTLLDSLARLEYPAYEVIVVDDRSVDGTARVATRPGVRLVRGTSRPAGWAGKQWACHQGAQVARGELLLFTDADTEHGPDGLARTVAELAAERADLVTALPYHASAALWERLLGPFHVLLLALTAPYAEPRPGRVYAIGQYLLFRREAYERLGGHAAVAATLVEDLPLANRCLAAGLRMHVCRGAARYQVRMYDSLEDFVSGWRRNFRAGFIYATPLAGIDAALLMAALTAGGRLSVPTAVVTGLALVFLAWRQRSLGRFSVLGVVFWPVSLGIFCFVTGLALFDLLLRRDLIWKGRAYPCVR